MSGLSFGRWVGFGAAGALLLAMAVPATEASAATSSQTVTVPATQPWTDTGISLPAGTVSFQASGIINVSGGDPAYDETPAGDGPADPTCIAGPNSYSGSWTAPGLPCWSLIGRIGNGTPFFVGDSYQAVIKNPGELYLGVDDETGQFGDNSGSWTVQASWTSSPSCTYSPTVTFSPNSGSVGTTFTITGKDWAPGGTVTATLPYGSPGWFTGYQSPTVDANGGFSYQETVGTGPNGPTPPGAYTFTYAENYGGCSLNFHQTFAVTPATPAAPSNLTATADDSQHIRLNWRDNSNNESGFEINNGVVSRKVGANSTTYTWGGLTPGTYMCFRIRAYNSAGDSAWEPDVSPWYRCATTPVAPIKDVNYSPWAGYSIDFTNPQNTPLSVSAAWTIPKVSCTNNGTPISGQVAVWDGLGGVYSGNDLEQIGTDSQCIKGKAKYWAWYEFPPQNPVPINKSGKYPVSYGDSMRAAVTYQGAGQFALQLWDDTKHWYYPVLWINHSSNAVPRTGEWIVEDPAGATWPQFTNNVVFKNCYWVQNGQRTALRFGVNITRYTIYTTGLLPQPKDVTWDPAPDRTDFAVQWQHY